MPFIFRAMLREEDKPRIGRSPNMLGVRVPPAVHSDVSLGSSGNALPGNKGMSVAPNWRTLPAHRLPRRLRNFVPRASGPDIMSCWRLAEFPFVDGPLTPELHLRIDSATHGQIAPSVSMPLEQFEDALARTRDFWIIDES